MIGRKGGEREFKGQAKKNKVWCFNIIADGGNAIHLLNVVMLKQKQFTVMARWGDMSSLAMCMLVFWIFFELLPGSTFRLQVDFLVAPQKFCHPSFPVQFLLEMKERKVWELKELKNDGGDAAKYKVKFEGAG